MRITSFLILLGLPACAFPGGRAALQVPWGDPVVFAQPLDQPPWSHQVAGACAWYVSPGLWNHHTAESTITLIGANFGDPVTIEARLVGELSVALGGEYFLSEDWSVLFGFDHRQMAPTDTPGFIFDTVTSDEWALGARWHMPYPFGPAGRWRPFLQTKLSYVPSTEFSAEVDLDTPPYPNPKYEFNGSSYWNAGLAVGVEYQVGPGLVFQASLMHEIALGTTQDRVDLEFLPGFNVPMKTEIEPEGTMLLVGLSFIR